MKKILLLVFTLCAFSRLVYSDISWSSPESISTALTDATDPHIVIDSSDNATAVWVENGFITASSHPSAGSWSSPQIISTAMTTSSNPKLGIDSTGNVTATWIEDDFLVSATLPFGGSWGSVTSPAISDTGATDHILAVDGSGNAVAIWVRGGFVESSTRISGTWSNVFTLSAANSSNPHIAISDFGKAIAAWHSVISSADVIVTDILTISGNSWAATKNVFNGTASFLHNYPKVAMDVNGNANVAWFRYNLLDGTAFENVQVITSTLSLGAAAWSLPSLLSDPGIRNPADLTLKLRFDTSGDAVAVWTNSYDAETFRVESAKKLFGGIWQPFVLIGVPTLYSLGIDAAIVSGTTLLTNMAWDGTSSILIQSQVSDIPIPLVQAWTPSNSFSAGDDNAFPKCAISLTGNTFNAASVWNHFDGTNKIIHAALGTDTAIDPPSNIAGDQNLTDFGVYQDYFNTITWDASSDPDITQYNIYRNGVFVNAVDPGTLEYIDHNSVQNETVIYGVAAITSSFRQSAITQFTLIP